MLCTIYRRLEMFIALFELVKYYTILSEIMPSSVICLAFNSLSKSSHSFIQSLRLVLCVTDIFTKFYSELRNCQLKRLFNRSNDVEPFFCNSMTLWKNNTHSMDCAVTTLDAETTMETSMRNVNICKYLIAVDKAIIAQC